MISHGLDLPEGSDVIEAEIGGKHVRFCIQSREDKIQRKHAAGKFWELDELIVMAAYLPKAGVFCDIGANVGNHSLYALIFMGASRVIAFEPNPASIALLRANVGLNGLSGQVDLSHLGWGLSDRTDQGLSMITKRANLGATRLVADGQGSIPVRPGDEMIGAARIDFIKLDVEGMEMQALRGLERTIAANRPPVFLELDHANAPAFHDWVAAHDYVVVHEGPRYAENQDLLILPQERKVMP